MVSTWLASSGTLSGECGASLLGEVVLGLATDKGDLGVGLSVSGSTKLGASGTLAGEGRTIYVQAKGEAGGLEATGEVNVRLGPLGEWKLAKIDHVLCDRNEGESEKITLVTF